MTRRLVLFDCDGTLLDSHGSIAAAVRLAFTDHRLPPPSAEEVRALIGLSADAMIHVLCQDLQDAPEEAILASYRCYFRSELFQSSSCERMAPGIEGAIATLASAGTVLGIVTGKMRDTLARALDTFDLTDTFPVKITADDGPSKPAPDLVLAALEEAGIAPARTVVVGDTVFDVLMARAAGVPSIGVTWGAHSGENLRRVGAHLVVNRPGDLPAAVDALLPARAPAVMLH